MCCTPAFKAASTSVLLCTSIAVASEEVDTIYACQWFAECMRVVKVEKDRLAALAMDAINFLASARTQPQTQFIGIAV